MTHKWVVSAVFYCLVSVMANAKAQELDLLAPCAQRSYTCNLEFFSEDRPVVRETVIPPDIADVKSKATYVKQIFAATSRSVDMQRIKAGESDCNRVFPRVPTTDITYSRVLISIPTSRKVGDQGLDEEGSALRNIYVIECQALSKHRFLAAISAEPTDQLLLYIHGNGNSFRSASQRMAQIAVDVHFNGPALLFSWPTGESNTLSSYELSEKAIWPTVTPLKHIFASTLQHLGRRTHVISHSLGSRLTIGVLVQIIGDKTDFQRLSNLILAAPDTDENEFRLAQSKYIRWTADQISIYCGDVDFALLISWRLHGWVPLGTCQLPLKPLQGAERIRVIGPTGSVTRHFYYADSPTVLRDLEAIIKGAPNGFGRQQASGAWLLKTGK